MYGNNYYPQMNNVAGMLQNPYESRLNYLQQNQNIQQFQRYDIIHVNGENGARSFRMAPNSSAILLDDTAPIVWLCQSDGAGYHTVEPYAITPYKPQTTNNSTELEQRVSRLEGIINEKFANGRSEQPDVTSVKQSRKRSANAESSANDNSTGE